jgi:hypothetical protein
MLNVGYVQEKREREREREMEEGRQTFYNGSFD